MAYRTFVKKKHSRPYLLLELLVAITLVAMSTLLFLQKPKCLLEAEITALVNMELQRLAEVAFAAIKTDLYQHKITCEELSKQKGNKALSYEKDTPAVINLKGIQNYRFNTSYTVAISKEKKGKNGEDFKILQIKLSFSPVHSKKFLKKHTYTYKLFVSLV